ncbi:D-TA family PLP-dependent enzyme [Flavivirga spongiicola]|uniref:D-TA family PLP-dependent enzyme n=1 Tax=Flavivirga spongiicola TaxID=421621 RepID=A0ABU7XQQ1_9FLAO|nr:D-TA family PLP-dependent enzyme [Flavivirga sp. MEBiC05379]MDO5978096.1 D-TA family PLP-dependent enzyme [Flavivirga sp. MEBiC05379]
MEHQKWYEINDAENMMSPSLLVYPNRIEENIKTMIQIAGRTDALRPHIKTHKIAEIINLQLKYGITKFKCATIAEAELLATCGAKDILLAMQPVGIQIKRFFELILKFPNSKFSTIVDCEKIIQEIAKISEAKNIPAHLWLDINNGMNRTGVLPNSEALELYQKINDNTNLIAKGLHVYDGHIHESDYNLRKEVCDKAFFPVLQLKNEIENSGIKIKTIVAGGTPTFPIHIKRKNVEVSPGTPLLWDQGYASNYKDLKFLPAAVLLSSVVSKPDKNLICLDLGHKSVAAEMPFPRVKILNFKYSQEVSHSEEHLVMGCNESEKHEIGTICYGIPTHICPTVAKYKNVLVVVDGKVTGSWAVAARDQIITI